MQIQRNVGDAQLDLSNYLAGVLIHENRELPWLSNEEARLSVQCRTRRFLWLMFTVEAPREGARTRTHHCLCRLHYVWKNFNATGLRAD